MSSRDVDLGIVDGEDAGFRWCQLGPTLPNHMDRSRFINKLDLDDRPWIVGGFIHIDALHIHGLVVEKLNPLPPAVRVDAVQA